MTYDPLDLVYVEPPPATVPARTHNVRVAESQWTAVGDDRADGGARSVLHTQIRLNGLPLDLYLLEVTEGPHGAPQVRQSNAGVELADDALKHRRTVAVRGRRYIAVALTAEARAPRGT